jgi:hypothetical protein
LDTVLYPKFTRSSSDCDHACRFSQVLNEFLEASDKLCQESELAFHLLSNRVSQQIPRGGFEFIRRSLAQMEGARHEISSVSERKISFFFPTAIVR